MGEIARARSSATGSSRSAPPRSRAAVPGAGRPRQAAHRDVRPAGACRTRPTSSPPPASTHRAAQRLVPRDARRPGRVGRIYSQAHHPPASHRASAVVAVGRRARARPGDVRRHRLRPRRRRALLGRPRLPAIGPGLPAPFAYEAEAQRRADDPRGELPARSTCSSCATSSRCRRGSPDPGPRPCGASTSSTRLGHRGRRNMLALGADDARRRRRGAGCTCEFLSDKGRDGYAGSTGAVKPARPRRSWRRARGVGRHGSCTARCMSASRTSPAARKVCRHDRGMETREMAEGVGLVERLRRDARGEATSTCDAGSRRLEAEVQECRALNVRLAELTDIVDRAAAPGGRPRRGEAGGAAREVPRERLSQARRWPAQVFLHIGLPKTGTTYLQSVLWGPTGRPARPTGSCCPGAATASTSGPPSSCRSGRSLERRHPKAPGALAAGWSTSRQPAQGDRPAHPRVHVRCRPRAGAPAGRVAGARRGARRHHRPRRPRHAHLRVGGVRQERRHQAPAPRCPATARGAGRVRLAHLGPRPVSSGAGPGDLPASRCTCCRCPAPASRATSTGATSPACSASTPTGTTRRRTRQPRARGRADRDCCGG